MTMQATNPAGDYRPAVQELQGFKVSLLAGALANTKIDLAAIRPEDHILMGLNNNAGTITDVTDTLSKVDCRASGTITVGTVVNGNTCVIQGVTYTFKTTPGSVNTELPIGTANANATALAAAINAVEDGPSGLHRFYAEAATNVVTIRARDEGTGGNAYTTVGSANLVASGATLAGGTATGGIKSTGVTNQVILFWFNKHA